VATVGGEGIVEGGFQQVNTLGVRCLVWTERGLYACADPFVDGYTVGLSGDAGKSFAPLMQLSSACGPPANCAPGSSVAQACTPRWAAERDELGASDCEVAATPDAGCRWAVRGTRAAGPRADRGQPATGWFILAGLMGLFRYRARRRSRRRRPVRA
jgi:hypothetical protein